MAGSILALSAKSIYLMDTPFRKIPNINSLLREPFIYRYIETLGRSVVLEAIRQSIDIIKKTMPNIENSNSIHSQLIFLIENKLQHRRLLGLQAVVNATGVILHTNLGRAPLGEQVMDYILASTKGYSNLEYDLIQCKRGNRYAQSQNLLQLLTGAEAATIVNNNAAAVFLVLKVFGETREVIVSRSELVEIGGSFRIPEIMAMSGAKMVEVGTTNRTRISDYEHAITNQTTILFKTHQSNFQLIGFTEDPSIIELKKLAKRKQLLLFYDIGSGLLKPCLPAVFHHEPTVKQAINEGADLVLFSGDKLLGGPQCGIIIGRRPLIEKINAHPLMRTYRLDKLCLAALEATLLAYTGLPSDTPNLPIFSFLTRSLSTLQKMADTLYKKIDSLLTVNGFKLEIVESVGRCGGGTMPGKSFPSIAIAVSHPKIRAEHLYKMLLNQEKPIVGVLRSETLQLDMFCISESDLTVLISVLPQILCNILLSELPDM